MKKRLNRAEMRNRWRYRNAAKGIRAVAVSAANGTVSAVDCTVHVMRTLLWCCAKALDKHCTPTRRTGRNCDVKCYTFDRTATFLAAHFKARYPISYADAFSAALTKIKDAELLTGDPEFKAVESEIRVHWLPC